MATTTLTLNPTLITVPSNTAEHDIDFTAVLPKKSVNGFTGHALVQWISGTAKVSFNSNGQAITAVSAGITSTETKLIIPLTVGTNLRYKGANGAETFNIIITD
jgi:hypothetical protein